jgi:colanic acid/amylovoran biosynthesis glycosyltransferase
MRWAQRFELPLVVTFHGGDVTFLLSAFERYRPKNLRYGLLAGRLFRSMTLGLCASRELLGLLAGIGVPEHKLREHRLGVDLSGFGRRERASRPARVAMIGRFVEKKGFAYGLRAFAEVAASRPTVELVLVGEGELEGELRALASSLGVGQRVRFAGSLAPGAVSDLLAESDVLLAPSVVDRGGNRESGTIVVKEASASEVVPIGSVHGGIPDIIEDGVTGYLVTERDVPALARQLGALLDDPALRARMGRAAREKMQREYDNRACVARLEEFYDEALCLHRRAREG